MNIAVIGTGYVGLVTGTCFAEFGNQVTCIDVNETKINDLKNGKLPIYEPGLDTLVLSNMQAGRLSFALDLHDIAEHPNVIFIAVGTPSNAAGAANIQYVLDAATNIGQYINHNCVIVDKSTVPVGMGDQVARAIQTELNKRGLLILCEVVSNPEFLREGAAIEDFMRPDRVIIGLDQDRAKQIMLDLYLPIVRNPERIYFMDVKAAEMTKYVANAMLATRISFMNEMAALCEKMNVDIEKVRMGIGSDSRIGNAFLNAGCGYGGSCFPKDVRALIRMAEDHNVEPVILHAVENRNAEQKQVLFKKIQRYFGAKLHGSTIALWGLAFKPGTDDMREASSLALIEALLLHNVRIQAYDPAAMPVARELLAPEYFESERIVFAENQYDALKGVDALALLTEWKPFCYPDLNAMKKLMKQWIIFDGRNQFDPKQIKENEFYYEGIGRGAPSIEKIVHNMREKMVSVVS